MASQDTAMQLENLVQTGHQSRSDSHLRAHLSWPWRTETDTSKESLYGPSRRLLQVIGQFEGKCMHGNNTTTQTVYVVSGLKTNLLGLPAITALNLATRVDATTETPSVMQMYPSVFQGLGNLGEEYTIKIKPGAKPYALFTPRNIPLPL